MLTWIKPHTSVGKRERENKQYLFFHLSWGASKGNRERESQCLCFPPSLAPLCVAGLQIHPNHRRRTREQLGVGRLSPELCYLFLCLSERRRLWADGDEELEVTERLDARESAIPLLRKWEEVQGRECQRDSDASIHRHVERLFPPCCYLHNIMNNFSQHNLLKH